MATRTAPSIGNRIAPVRFLVFLALLVPGGAFAGVEWGWRTGVMSGFDVASAVFLVSLWPLFGTDIPGIRARAAANDANRALLLVVTGIVMLTVLTAVGAELQKGEPPSGPMKAAIVATLALAWLFSNMVYALHYAHLFYSRDRKAGGDVGGLDFSGTGKPSYSDFVYFAFTLGMTFQTSDTGVTTPGMRRIVTCHCFAAFVFNLGVLAFTINVLGSAR
ncbi:MAG: DUF1345 domain-containing protein [Alphaproteobacteria bacterium]|nr:DUF1345 domain-containing protein [Alphaproteobacteria bacterium]